MVLAKLEIHTQRPTFEPRELWSDRETWSWLSWRFTERPIFEPRELWSDRETWS